MRSRVSARAVLCAVVLVLLNQAAGARAQEASADAAPPTTDQEARSLFQAGQIAFDGARYDDALAHFRRAYELSQRVPLLYNVGLCLSNLGRWQEAVDAFEEYLEREPHASNRATVEGQVRNARARLAERAPATEAPSRSVAPLVLLIGSSAVAVTSAVFLVLGTLQVGDLQDTPDGTRQWSDVDSDLSRAHGFQIGGAIGLAVGAVGAVLSLVWWLSSEPSAPPQPLAFRF